MKTQNPSPGMGEVRPSPSLAGQPDYAVFDRARVAAFRARAVASFAEHDFLFSWAGRELYERLTFIARTFSNALLLGARGPLPALHADGKLPKIENLLIMDMDPSLAVLCPESPFVSGDEEFLPFGTGHFDLILSCLGLHTVNDLPGALVQIRRCLKPDGLFTGAMLGGETLHELRAALMQAEMELRGGISPRVAPFADKPQAGALLQRAGFALPVVDSEILTVTYDSAFKLMKDLRGMGEGNAILARDKVWPGKALFARAAQIYQERFSEEDGRIKASFEILFLSGWAPHESQQKPLRPGSAERSLAEALDTAEIKTGEEAKP